MTYIHSYASMVCNLCTPINSYWCHMYRVQIFYMHHLFLFNIRWTTKINNAPWSLKWNAPLVGYSRETVSCVPLNARNARGIISSLLVQLRASRRVERIVRVILLVFNIHHASGTPASVSFVKYINICIVQSYEKFNYKDLKR